MIPKINVTQKKASGSFNFPTKILYYYGNSAYIEVLTERLSRVLKAERIEMRKNGKDNADIQVFCDEETGRHLLWEDIPQKAGAYKLIIDTDKVLIQARDTEGAASALTTLYWEIRMGGGSCQCQVIIDAPEYGYRGILLDCSRHFFDIETVRLIVEQSALRKINRLHWHLSDDQGYRIESKVFPLLNSIGSYRKEDNEPNHSGYYSQCEIKDMVQFAKVRGIEIIPEIDLPGHVSSMIAAYPQWSCSGEEMEVSCGYAVHNRVLCAGKEETLSDIFQLIREVSDLFPFKQFHIGGDEVPKEEWKNCPQCQKKRIELGLQNDEELQSWFTSQILAYLHKIGKEGICWNDVFKDHGFNEDCVIQYWDEGNDSDCTGVFNGNRKCIYSYAPAYYLNFMPSIVPMRKTFNIEKKMRHGELIDKNNLLGFEAALWSEQIYDSHDLQRKMFPRAFALAQRGWSEGGDYAEFKNRCEEELDRLLEDGIESMSLEEADLSGDEQRRAIIEEWKPALQYIKQNGVDKMEKIIHDMLQSMLAEVYTDDSIAHILAELKE